MNNNSKTFYKVTNEDIYKKLEVIEVNMDCLKRDNKNTKWIAGTALTISLITIGALISL